MTVGVVIPVGPGRLENLTLTLACLARQTRRPAVVLVVQDGPVEESPQVLNLAYAVLAREKHQPGMVQPRNAGVRWLTESFPQVTHAWFLDSDVLVADDCLEQLLAALDAGERQRVLCAPYDWARPGVRTLVPRDDPGILLPDPRWSMFDEPRWAGGGHSIGEINVGLGCFSGHLVWPVREFARVGGFWDELSHGRVEDGELGLRAVAQGVPISCVPAARGMHLWHPVSHDWVTATNAREVPLITARHEWVAAEGLFVADRDGARFEQTCRRCRHVVNTIDWWAHTTTCPAAA